MTRSERLRVVAPGTNGRLRVWSVAVEASVEGEVDPASGMVVNLADLKRELRERVTLPWDGRCLDGADGVPELRTPERLAGGVWAALRGRLGGLTLRRVRLTDESGWTVDCRGGEQVDVTRLYEFSASHRLHSECLDETENRRLFGKCNNPAGHGHNYVLEVTLRGRPGASGELLEEGEFDRVVREEVVDRWDHRHLNSDLEEFDGVNPTAEEIARVAWRRLEAPLRQVARAAAPGDVRLYRVKLRETARNHVEYFGPESEGSQE